MIPKSGNRPAFAKASAGLRHKSVVARRAQADFWKRSCSNKNLEPSADSTKVDRVLVSGADQWRVPRRPKDARGLTKRMLRRGRCRTDSLAADDGTGCLRNNRR